MDDKGVAAPQVSQSPSPSESVKRFWKRLGNRQEFVVLVLFVAIFLFLALWTTTFLTNHNLSSLARNFSWIAVAALGQGMVIIIGGIDLSVGATLAMAGLVAARCMQAGLPVPLGIVAGLFVGVVVGWINGNMIARIRLPAYIVTLGTMIVVRGLAYGLTQGWSVTNLPEGFLALGQYDITLGAWSVPLSVLLAFGIALLVSLLLNRTVVGNYIFALSGGERALLASGVNVVRLKVLVYTLCGLLAAASGLLMTARLGVAAPEAAVGYEVDIIAAAVIGGTSLFGGVGGTLGILLGAAVTQMLSNGLVFLGFPSYWQSVAIGALMLLTILLDYWRRQRRKD